MACTCDRVGVVGVVWDSSSLLSHIGIILCFGVLEEKMGSTPLTYVFLHVTFLPPPPPLPTARAFGTTKSP